ncbi:uncharacterized protein ARMOST_08227 [Armillaria ostoyae]|uniref:Retrotransposon gag domain-containing protein n=1 Tax=Armillaria ostoyae TaxID=47428 RepID=A0A284R806_ARMOS|nr:uncharacterized protein ARMOST_08227 [Armillaria ostoyae]
MTPNEISILVTGLIGGALLLSCLVTLLVLTYADQLRRLLQIRPLAPVTPALPGHYVLPYLQPGPLMEPVGQIHAPTPQRRATYPATSSDDNLPLPPRNATPGPSNVPRTPPPAYNPEEEAQEYGRFLRAVFRSPTPDLPLITIPDSPPAPVRALLPESDNEAPRLQTPIHRQPIPRSLPASAIQFTIPAHLCPLPDSDNSNSNSSDYGGNEPIAEREDDDPLNPHGLDYEWPELEAIDRAYLGPYRSQAWELRRLDIEQRSAFEGPENRVQEDVTQQYAPASTVTVSGQTIPQLRETESIMPDPAPTRSNAPSPTSYWPSHLPRAIAPTSTEPPDFDHFNQDPETFGWADKEDEENTRYDGDYQGYAPIPNLYAGDYRGYTTAPHFYHQPFPLPDSPTYNAPHPRRVQQYHPPQYGQYIMGGQDPPKPVPGGSNDPPVDPIPPNPAERLQEAKDLADQKAERIQQMREALAAEEQAHDDHVQYWNLPNQNQRKGKEPERGRPGAPPAPNPNWRRPLHEHEDRWSLPRPPPKWRNEPPQPMGDADDDAPYLGIKPVMIRPPVPFEGKYDDIERFIGDCCMYFEVFAPYFQLHSQRVTFATSYFEGTAKDWWVHRRQEFWSSSTWDDGPRHFRFPSWAEFVGLVSRQFHDPATQDIHEKRMFDLRMGKGPAISYFNELEIEAKKAGRREDDQERGLMVKAVRLGVPNSYTNAIASSGEHIPSTYHLWLLP